MDIGCEGGRWTRYLVDRAWSVTCTDIDPTVLATCQARHPGVKTVLVSGDDERFPAEDDSVDFLLVYEVRAVMQAAWFPAEALRVLKPKGVLAFTAHNPLSIRGLAYLTLHRTGLRRRSGHFYEGPAYPQLRRALRQLGFQMVREEGMAWFPFHRESDSPLIPAVSTLERAIGLRRLVSVSPWIVAIAQRAEVAP
jgi:SAM-dependent methyltransferase